MNKRNITIIIIAAVLAVLGIVYAGAKIYAGNIAERGVKEVISAVSGYFNVEYKKVSVNLFAMDLKISDMVISPAGTPPGSEEEIRIKELVIHDIETTTRVPNYLSFSARGIDVNLYEMENTIKEMGYDKKLLYDLSVNYRYYQDKKEFAINKFAFGTDKAGELDISLYFTNINLDPEMIMYTVFSYPEIVLKEAKLNYTDKSLAGRLMSLESKLYNNNVDEYKMFMNQEMESRIEEESDEALKNAYIEIKKFINNPKKISISLNPQAPQPIGNIMRSESMQEIVNMLNLKISQ